MGSKRDWIAELMKYFIISTMLLLPFTILRLFNISFVVTFCLVAVFGIAINKYLDVRY